MKEKSTLVTYETISTYMIRDSHIATITTIWIIVSGDIDFQGPSLAFQKKKIDKQDGAKVELKTTCELKHKHSE